MNNIICSKCKSKFNVYLNKYCTTCNCKFTAFYSTEDIRNYVDVKYIFYFNVKILKPKSQFTEFSYDFYLSITNDIMTIFCKNKESTICDIVQKLIDEKSYSTQEIIDVIYKTYNLQSFC